jgi:hypothetical protein
LLAAGAVALADFFSPPVVEFCRPRAPWSHLPQEYPGDEPADDAFDEHNSVYRLERAGDDAGEQKDRRHENGNGDEEVPRIPLLAWWGNQGADQCSDKRRDQPILHAEDPGAGVSVGKADQQPADCKGDCGPKERAGPTDRLRKEGRHYLT